MEGSLTTYRDLIVWQKSMDLVTHIYRLTKHFPAHELYGLTSQMRRAAISIPSNLAEGRRRGSRREFRQFVTIAYGSGSELETQLEIAKRLGYVASESCTPTNDLLDEIMKMLNRMIASLQATS